MERKLPDLMIIARDSAAPDRLCKELAGRGFVCSLVPYEHEVVLKVSEQSPDMVLVEVNGYLPPPEMRQFVNRIKAEKPVPVVALIAEGMLDKVDSELNVEDFLKSPYDAGELALRIRRLVRRPENADSSEVIKSGGLTIDLARCEVMVDGRIMELTFKEYELLKFLAANPGRVYTRETLLDKVWGMDYYGGDRTVDVHVRRLRSKIESSGHDFIETVRNIGYRFTKNS